MPNFCSTLWPPDMADVMGPMGLRCFSSESQSAKMEGKSSKPNKFANVEISKSTPNSTN